MERQRRCQPAQLLSLGYSPRVTKLLSAQAILDALDSLVTFFQPDAYGSTTATLYFGRAKAFCASLHRRHPICPLSAPVVVAYLDHEFGKFGHVIASDLLMSIMQVQLATLPHHSSSHHGHLMQTPQAHGPSSSTTPSKAAQPVHLELHVARFHAPASMQSQLSSHPL
ncbi:hypothetical protein H257_05130 [Aphanomyces astaci]|uniref:Uncharacterized protein n=1 Tax=Aphanomyces astaci TaxID=112090 RepID=W4GS53_APHAT|nr:hypothetical protein H257_05130 [Aphanomyces astaci]ETV82527.1 hypothetical protein H257_05130 [Aphanomyces astaci]|eukprot:XP_009828196.1 hypothetical protein H257_05130 [Aphanomyces astaci]